MPSVSNLSKICSNSRVHEEWERTDNCLSCAHVMHSVQGKESKSLVSLRDPETHIHGFKQEGGCLKKGLWREKAATLLQLSLELSCFNCCKTCTNRTFLR